MASVHKGITFSIWLVVVEREILSWWAYQDDDDGAHPILNLGVYVHASVGVLILTRWREILDGGSAIELGYISFNYGFAIKCVCVWSSRGQVGREDDVKTWCTLRLLDLYFSILLRLRRWIPTHWQLLPALGSDSIPLYIYLPVSLSSVYYALLWGGFSLDCS